MDDAQKTAREIQERWIHTHDELVPLIADAIRDAQRNRAMPKKTDGYVLMPLSHKEALALEREGEWLRGRYRQGEGRKEPRK